MKLFAPESYWTAKAHGHVHEFVDGGCGPGKFGDWLVPDTILGVNVTPACEIHDWMYLMGRTIEDKNKADRAFRNNLIRLIRAAKRPRLVPKCIWRRITRWRLRTAQLYYEAVRDFGGHAFWEGKNKNSEYREHTTSKAA